jgi:hypothetical protein
MSSWQLLKKTSNARVSVIGNFPCSSSEASVPVPICSYGKRMQLAKPDLFLKTGHLCMPIPWRAKKSAARGSGSAGTGRKSALLLCR